ncbi:MAG: hypothetical protein ACE3L7_00295 [Candidatus Pristimantibacillus sp.]
MNNKSIRVTVTIEKGQDQFLEILSSIRGLGKSELIRGFLNDAYQQNKKYIKEYLSNRKLDDDLE